MNFRVVLRDGNWYSVEARSWKESLFFPLEEGAGQLATTPRAVDAFWADVWNEQFGRHACLEMPAHTSISEIVHASLRHFKESDSLHFPFFGLDSASENGIEQAYLITIPDERRLDESSTLSAEGVRNGDMLALVVIYPAGHSAMLRSVPSAADLFSVIRSTSGEPPVFTNAYAAAAARRQAEREQSDYEFEQRFGTRERSPKMDGDENLGSRHLVKKSAQPVPRLWGALLYTDEDVDLATYVRRHFLSLSEVSSSDLHIFVVEAPEDGEAAERYWKRILSEDTYWLWKLMGWLSTGPYDKSRAYEIANSLGVGEERLPCLVLFDRIERPDKLVFPIVDISPAYFRQLFGALRRTLEQPTHLAEGHSADVEAIVDSPGGEFWDIDDWRSRLPLVFQEWVWMDEDRSRAAFEAVSLRYEAILGSVESVRATQPGQPEQFILNGQTVFINRPSGPVTLSHFQHGGDPDERS